MSGFLLLKCSGLTGLVKRLECYEKLTEIADLGDRVGQEEWAQQFGLRVLLLLLFLCGCESHLLVNT